MSTFFLEIYGEEIPSDAQVFGELELKKIIESFLVKNKIQFSKINSLSTSRRIIIFSRNVSKQTESEISEIIWATAVSWHFVCVVVEKAKIIDERGSFDKFLDDGLVEGVKEIVVGAFDGEGFVHWQPERAAPHG